MFKKGIHVKKLVNLNFLKKTLLTPTLRKASGFLMKLRHTQLGEKEKQRVQTKRAKPKSYFN